MSCINSSDGDVVILISHTGRTKSLVELAIIAKENDATVIGITANIYVLVTVSKTDEK